MTALSLLTDPNAWAALVTLTALEIVLGIDNLVFISVFDRAPRDEQGPPRPPDRPLPRFHLPRDHALRAHLAHGPHRAALYRFPHGDIVARHYSDRRRPVPHCQGDV